MARPPVVVLIPSIWYYIDMKAKKCGYCLKSFTPTVGFQKYCNYECYNEVQKEYKRKTYHANEQKTFTKVCKVCGIKFEARLDRTRFCGRKCYFLEQKQSRKGKNNPAYRNGTRTNGKSVSWVHLDTTRKYGKAFLEKYGYKFCENCGTNSSLRFETHHIIFASEKPRHENLHNQRNLILVCIKCHNDFHSGVTRDKRKDLVDKRNLVELFGKTIL